MKTRIALLAIAFGLPWLIGPDRSVHAQAQPPASALDSVLNRLTFRNIGPFRPGAWITDIAVPDTPARDHLYTVYAASRTGGLWKTINNGITWQVITDSIEVASVGAVAVAPSNAQIVWLGTGEQANARSSYSGKGLFKSIDAGATWQFMGLPDSHHIARIVIHPKNPDMVWVAAMGHLFSRNEERGVFRTTNGGKTWQKVLYVDDGTGATDLVINRQSPNILYAAMYEKHRMPWQLVLGGPGTGLYRSDDSGATWQKLGGGLPTGTLGRIGIDIYQKNPNLLYAVVENVNARSPEMGTAIDGCQTPAGRGRGGNDAETPGPGEDDDQQAQGRGRGGAPRVGNEIYRSDDGGKTWRKTHGHDVDVAGGKAPYSFNQLKIDTGNPDHLVVTSDQMYSSRDGGKTWGCTNTTGFFRGVFGDFRTIWWDAEDPGRIMLGSDGGVSVSYDGGRTAMAFVNKALGEVYAIGVDMDDPYNVYAGLQDHDSWMGPSNGKSGRITLDHWTTVGPGDGMYNQVDPSDSRWVYNTREMGNHGRFDRTTGDRTVIAPPAPAGATLRYNWVAPIVLSPHNPQTLYAGSQFLHRSTNRGDAWDVISPDLTVNEPGKAGRNSGSVPYATITSISESPVRAGVIWVGTDDGKVQVVESQGGSWRDATPALVSAGAPVDWAVSRVFASPHDAATAFVSKSGFRHDDFRPQLFKTTNLGKSWTRISANLPNEPINVVVQDRRNANLLIVGTDLAVHVSIDGGASWSRLKANLPAVAFHDLTIHPRENDLVLGTYGRAVWVGDITPLQDLSAATLEKAAHLFDIEPRARYGFGAIGNYFLRGNGTIDAPNEPDAIAINYYVKGDVESGARVSVADASGRVVATLTGPARRGLNRVQWSLGGGGGRGGAAGGPPPVGDYVVTLEVGSEKLSKPARVRERIGSR